MTYYNKKPKVSEKEDKVPYVTYWPHSLSRTDPRVQNKDNYFQVISIDPGVVNCAIRIERRYFDGKIVPIYFNLWKPRGSVKLETNEPNPIYAQMNALLDSIAEYTLESHLIVIERQLAINYKSSRLMQSIITYFHIFLKDKPKYPVIYDIDPKLKGKMLEAPPRCSGKELKDWSVEEAKRLLQMRGDAWSLDVLQRYKTKADDLADTICQVEALFRYWGIEPITRPNGSLSAPSAQPQLIIEPTSRSNGSLSAPSAQPQLIIEPKVELTNCLTANPAPTGPVLLIIED